MTAWAKADLAEDVLERLGVKPAGQAASAEDQIKAEATIDSVHAEFRRLGLVPFALDSIPDWAQIAMSKCVAGELTSHFGISGIRRMELEEEKRQGRAKLAEQVAADKHRVPIRTRHY